MTKPKGFVLWRGLSPFNGARIVAIMTLSTSNRKTGKMAQVWILFEDLSPTAAMAQGLDDSICGSCPHKKQANGSRSCYVNVGQAPQSVWKAWQRGLYPVYRATEHEDLVTGLSIRWGAYGDPAMLPANLVDYFNGLANNHTGYTHQWQQPWAQWARGNFQASCDGFNDYLTATDKGWRTFTVVSKTAQPSYAKQCPATVQHSKAQCFTCKLCDGAKADIFVNAHGSGSKYIVAA